MEIPVKTSKNITLPVLGLGTYAMGGKYEVDPNNDDKGDIAAIRFAIDSGITHFDTAEIYAAGHSEELLGRAIQGYAREKLFLTSKVAPENLTYDKVITSARSSLERIATQYLDLYLIHWPDPEVDLAETFKAMTTLIEEGMVKHIGVSNFGPSYLERALEVSKYPIVTNQIHLSLSARGHVTAGTIDWCRQHDVLITAYRPVHKKTINPKETLLQAMAEKYNATPEQISLAWVLAQDGVVTIVKSSNQKHIADDIAAINVQLAPEDITTLTNEFPEGETIHVYT